MLPPLRWTRPVLWAVIALGAPVGVLRAAVPMGPEFQVHTFTTGGQVRPSVALTADGSFVVAWNESPAALGGTSVRRFDATGSPLGGQMPVGGGWWPAAAIAPDGSFVVAFGGFDGSGTGIFARRFQEDGAALGGEFLVNSSTVGPQQYPALGMAPDGSFVVVWNGGTWDYAGYHVRGQRFDAGGDRRGGEISISQGYSGYGTSLALMQDGSFVVVWTGAQDGDRTGVFARRMAADGSPLGDEFQVNIYTTDVQAWPDVDATPSGDFVITWHSRFQDEAGDGVFARRYDAEGTPLGGEFQVKEDGPDFESFPHIGVDDAGNFTVVWFGTSDGSAHGVFGRSFDALGAPLGGSFQVNTYTTGSQGFFNAIASDGSGGFVVSWTSPDQDGDGDGVFGRRLGCQPFPDVVGGLEVGTEGGDLVMTWNSSSGAESYHVLEDTFPSGAFQTSAAATGCGDGICAPGLGEDCGSCPVDCSGVQAGNPANRFCCGDGLSGGETPVDCSDPRCRQGGLRCIGSAGVPGTTLVLPAGNRFYLVVGRTDSCGFGPRK